jgi:cytochrome d ubiquinol oxidase subunit II
MPALWYVLLATMLVVYVVLDGFDFGAGILHLFVAKTDEERRTVLAAIGPIWDGNEVWLIASGGVLVFAFPKAYASAFSGFYLPLMMLLWLLILRGISIEFRSHNEDPLWRAFWDAVFALSSTATAIVLGVAFGNLVRGVPVEEDGYFQSPLFTTFSPSADSGAPVGTLDWYTLSVGAFAAAVLTTHGAHFLAWKTSGGVHDRAARVAPRGWAVVGVLGALVTAGTIAVDRPFLRHFVDRPLAWIFIAVTIASAISAARFLKRGRELAAFVASCAFVASALGAAASALYPALLLSTKDDAYTITADRAASGRWGLTVGLAWWIPAILLAVFYFTLLFRSLRGKVDLGSGSH